MEMERYYSKVQEAIVTKAKAVKAFKVEGTGADNIIVEAVDRAINKDIAAIKIHFNSIRRKYADNFLMRVELGQLSTKEEAALAEYTQYLADVKEAIENRVSAGEYIYLLDDTDKEIAGVAVTGFFTLKFEEEPADCLEGAAYVFDKEQGKVVAVPTEAVKRVWGVFTNVLDSDEVYEYSANVTFEDEHGLIPFRKANVKEINKQWRDWNNFYSQYIIDNTVAAEQGKSLAPNIIYYDASKDTTQIDREYGYSRLTADTVQQRLARFNNERAFGRLQVCSDCGNLFRLTGSEIAFYTDKELSLPKRCFSCRTGGQKLVCCDCGKEFTLKNKEIQFYESKGFDLPKRCYDCRKTRKEKRANGTEKKA